MLRASRATERAWGRGPVRYLPVPWPRLGRVVTPMGGQVIQLIAAPGVGKSMFALNWAMKAGVVALYMSADTDSRLLTEQVAAYVTGEDRSTAAEGLADARYRGLYEDAMDKLVPRLHLDFTSGPSIGGIHDRAVALTEAYGQTPDLIVLDTATDLERENEDYAAWRKLWLRLRELSRTLDTTIVSAHHVREGLARDGKVPPRQSDGKYGADEFAEIVLGLHREHYGSGNLIVTVLKNRGGLKDVRVPFQAQYDRAIVEEVLHV